MVLAIPVESLAQEQGCQHSCCLHHARGRNYQRRSHVAKLPSNLRLQQDREFPGRTSDEADNSRYSADPALQERLAKMNFSTPGAAPCSRRATK